MTIKGIRTFIYPVKDITEAKELYGKLLSVEPYMDEEYYVGFRIEAQEVGLDSNGHNMGIRRPVGYWQVSDIKKEL